MSSRAFANAKFRWLEGITRDRGLLAIDVRIAAALLPRFNQTDQGGRAWPSTRTLADETGISDATVIRSVRRLTVRGHLIVVPGRAGRGYSNSYWMAGEKPAPVKVFETEKPSRRPAGKP